jgi:outer membrane protein
MMKSRNIGIDRVKWVMLGVALFWAGGCADWENSGTANRPVRTTRFERVEEVNLVDCSRSKPVTVEEATSRIAQQAAEPNQWRPVATLTLEQVRGAVLANNLDLKIDLVDPSIAARSVDVERAKFESFFFGSAGYERAQEVGTGDISKTWDSEVGIGQPLPTGGTIRASVPVTSVDADGTELAEAAASVSYVQSLLRAAGTRINTQSIRIAAHQWNIVSARTKLAAIQLLAGADVTYWRLYAAKKELDVRREQYKLAQNQLSHARKKVAAGSAPKIEIVRAEAGLASRLEAVIYAETTLQDWARELRRIMNDPNLPLESTAEIATQTEPDPLGLKLDKEELARQALAGRMETAELEQRLTIDDLNLELARNAALPDLTFRYTYAARTGNDSVGDALRDITRNSYDDHSVAVSATIPLGNEAAKARVQAARLARVQDRLSRDRLEQSIRQDVYEAVSTLDGTWYRVLAAEQGVTAAYRNYRVEQSQFQLGRRTSTDVLYAATSLADAQLSRIRALVDYEIAQINLARATGTLLGHDHIMLRPIELDDNG